jgi:hypothetical protein
VEFEVRKTLQEQNEKLAGIYAGDNQTHYRNDAEGISGHNAEYVDYRWG